MSSGKESEKKNVTKQSWWESLKETFSTLRERYYPTEQEKTQAEEHAQLMESHNSPPKKKEHIAIDVQAAKEELIAINARAEKEARLHIIDAGFVDKGKRKKIISEIATGESTYISDITTYLSRVNTKINQQKKAGGPSPDKETTLASLTALFNLVAEVSIREKGTGWKVSESEKPEPGTFDEWYTAVVNSINHLSAKVKGENKDNQATHTVTETASAKQTDVTAEKRNAYLEGKAATNLILDFEAKQPGVKEPPLPELPRQSVLGSKLPPQPAIPKQPVQGSKLPAQPAIPRQSVQGSKLPAQPAIPKQPVQGSKLPPQPSIPGHPVKGSQLPPVPAIPKQPVTGIVQPIPAARKSASEQARAQASSQTQTIADQSKKAGELLEASPTSRAPVKKVPEPTVLSTEQTVKRVSGRPDNKQPASTAVPSTAPRKPLPPLDTQNQGTAPPLSRLSVKEQAPAAQPLAESAKVQAPPTRPLAESANVQGPPARPLPESPKAKGSSGRPLPVSRNMQGRPSARGPAPKPAASVMSRRSHKGQENVGVVNKTEEPEATTIKKERPLPPSPK